MKPRKVSTAARIPKCCLSLAFLLLTLLCAACQPTGTPPPERPAMPTIAVENQDLETVIPTTAMETQSSAPRLAGCPVFPPDHIWNSPVDGLPVHPSSQIYINAIGPDQPLHPDFGSGEWEGEPIGIPFAIVPPDQPAVTIAFMYADESDPGPYPIPPQVPIEGGYESEGDRHVLILARDSCLLYEIYAAYPQPDGTWRAGSGAVFDLRSYQLRPQEWTSADAAGLPILPGLVRYDEVAQGEIRHAIRFTAPRTQRAYVWPARHFASDSRDPSLPPMGLRLRLRADFDLSPFAPEVQVILRALKRYGMILADNGAAWFISGAPDARWDNETLRQLRDVQGSDFEVVDVSSLMLSPDSGQVRSEASSPSD